MNYANPEEREAKAPWIALESFCSLGADLIDEVRGLSRNFKEKA